MAKAKQKSQPAGAERGSQLARESLDAKSWGISQGSGLRLLVFVAGLVLMGLEIAGSRVLAPHFGNSVFVWGSLISVFLIALAVGYYAGGVLVDRRPSQRLLSVICMFASAWIFALASVGYRIGMGLSESGLGEQWGPLIAAAILFLPPSVALGMVSPFGVRIAATTISGLGKVSGSLYALSTVGSIVGTLLTTFVLIPAVGVSVILRILGVLLLATSLVTFPIRKSIGGVAPLTIAALIMAGSVLLPTSAQTIRLGANERILHDEDTPYHHVTVVENDLSRMRQLRFDKNIESGIYLKDGYPTSILYPDYFHLAFLMRPKMERVLFIGAGGGVGPRTFLAHDDKLKIDVVDIDKRVLEIAQAYFYLPESAAISVIARDGRMFLRKTTNTYDCIVLDAFTIGGRIPFHLVTRESLELCRDRLAPDGVFVVNMGSALEGPQSGIFRSLYRTASAVFPNVYVFALNYREVGTTQTTNVFLVASMETRSISESEWRAKANEYDSGLRPQVPNMVKLVSDQILVGPPDDGAAILTDDFAAIETMPH